MTRLDHTARHPRSVRDPVSTLLALGAQIEMILQQRKAERRSMIADAASALLAERGYVPTRLQEIAAAAGGGADQAPD